MTTPQAALSHCQRMAGASAPGKVTLSPSILVSPRSNRLLYHGTASRNLDAIFADGLKPGRRPQVHLSLDLETARRVAERHGKPTVLTVDAGRMHVDGYGFVRADNGVWLTDHVPPVYLDFAILHDEDILDITVP